jgi:hypothetical protein
MPLGPLVDQGRQDMERPVRRRKAKSSLAQPLAFFYAVAALNGHYYAAHWGFPIIFE